MTQQLSNDWEAETIRYCEASKAMAQIMNADIFDIGLFPDAVPGLSQVDQMHTGFLSNDDKRVAIYSG